eukprot:scaffold801_cov178-Ochromonas_danica.AAC.12
MSGRRTWDKEFYEKKAKERLEYGDEYVDGSNTTSEVGSKKQTAEVREEFRPATENEQGPLGSQRAFLKSRESKIELEDKVGKVEILNPSDGDKAGFWCEVCKCLLKDSASYLDHINGKKRKSSLFFLSFSSPYCLMKSLYFYVVDVLDQRALGYSMRVERADVDTVKQRLADLKRKLVTAPAPKLSAVEEYKQKLAKQEAEKEDFKRRRKEEQQSKKSQEKERRHNDDDDEEEVIGEVDPALAAMMGMSKFGSTKR